AQERLGLGLGRAVDVDLGLDDGHETRGEHLAAELELLVDDGGDARLARLLDDRALLGAEHAVAGGPGEELVEAGDRLHELDAVGLLLEALVDLEEGDDALLLPQVLRRALAADL